MKNILVVAVVFLSIVMLFVACCGFVPSIWFCDIVSQFRLVLAAVLGVCVFIALLLRSKIAIVVSVLGFLVNIFPIVPMYPKPASEATGASQSLSILNFNTEFQHNDHYELFFDLIHSRAPDVVALVEVNKKWINAIEPAMKVYPYREIMLEGPGMALYSKFPIQDVGIYKFGKSFHPRIIAQIQFDKGLVSLIVAHPTTPQSEGGFVERNREFDLLKKEMKDLSSPKILVGDLNCGPWSPAFSNLVSSTGLIDSEQGIGPQPSWPARTGRVLNDIFVPPFVPIDHVLVSQDIAVTQREVGPSMQSDHLPVFVNLLVKRKLP
ncbi:MAG: endonuclease/exonuclease/phosphatase family protein [Cyanobacteria bacterium SZAS-4]|nr:endonuclease/exonuclease/phosphatase family protein [Cyanobacteria bacterium SZAS-4]